MAISTIRGHANVKELEEQRDLRVTLPKVNFSNSQGNMIYHIQISVQHKYVLSTIHPLNLISALTANQTEKERKKWSAFGCEGFTFPLQRFKHKHTPSHTCRHQLIASAGKQTRFKQHGSLSRSLFFNPLDPQHVTDNADTKERVGASENRSIVMKTGFVAWHDELLRTPKLWFCCGFFVVVVVSRWKSTYWAELLHISVRSQVFDLHVGKHT